MSRHLSLEELLRHMDGELPVLHERFVRSHLRMCWSCQAEMERVKSSIVEIFDAQTTLVDPESPPPPAPWARLESMLELASGTDRIPFPTRPRVPGIDSGRAIRVMRRRPRL